MVLPRHGKQTGTIPDWLDGVLAPIFIYPEAVVPFWVVHSNPSAKNRS